MSHNFVISYTAYNDYQTCPKKFFHKYVAKNYPFEKSEALVWGRAVHDAFKRRLCEGAQFPVNMKNFEPVAAAMASMPQFISEKGMAIMRDGAPCDWSTRSALLKSKPDVVTFNSNCTVAMNVDIKTGKTREDPTELMFQSLVLKAHFPQLRKIKASYYWAPTASLGVVYDLTDEMLRTHDIVRRFADTLEAKFYSADVAGAFNATPGPLCGWCAAPGCPHAE